MRRKTGRGAGHVMTQTIENQMFVALKHANAPCIRVMA